MAARSIKESDKVRIYMNGDSYLSGLANTGFWTVTHAPCDVGDAWVLAWQDGTVIEINPMSANFDGLELVEKEEDSNGS
uniref:Uncharacterized protein n=1 Tax=viral metagenome TaxID=1070528 RepID=A0A6H1ZDP7_9ZZZZ